MSDVLDRLRLARTDGIGPATYRRLLERYGSADAAIDALPGLARAGGRSRAPEPPSRDAATSELEANAARGARLLFVDGPDYPPLLAMLSDAPSVIAVQGDAALLCRRAVGVVGSRRASVNGRSIAETLAEALARAGLAIVSGLARGIDAAAHVGALRGGGTVACIAGGLDRPYPPEHEGLQAAIVERGGAVVAEMPLGTPPLARHFPRRNRLIAGLSLGVVVIEAAPRSGSLITARLALEAGREVFAVPGSPLDARCQGTNDLIRQGAHMTETAADVLANLPDHPAREGLGRDPLFARAEERPVDWQPVRAPAERIELTDRAREEIASLLGAAPTSVDDLVRRCQLSAPAVMSALLELELAGRVETLSGNRVTLLQNRDRPLADRTS